MKSTVQLAFAMALLLAASCNKADNQPHATGAILMNSWNIGQTSYRATTILGNGAELIASQTNGSVVNTFKCRFSGNSLPATAGSYKIVSANPGPNEVVIRAANGNASYTASGNDNSAAQVYIQNNKVMINTSIFWAVSDASARDSVEVHGSISQQ